MYREKAQAAALVRRLVPARSSRSRHGIDRSEDSNNPSLQSSHVHGDAYRYSSTPIPRNTSFKQNTTTTCPEVERSSRQVRVVSASRQQVPEHRKPSARARAPSCGITGSSQARTPLKSAPVESYGILRFPAGGQLAATPALRLSVHRGCKAANQSSRRSTLHDSGLLCAAEEGSSGIAWLCQA